MKNSGNLTVSTPSDLEIEIVRVFNASKDLVYRAWTTPDLLKRWLYGWDDWSLAVCEMDLRPEGKIRWEWHGPAGERMGLSGQYREIVPDERLVHTELFDEDWTGGETLVTTSFTEQAGQTTVSMKVRYSSQEARDAALKSGMEDGLAVGYNRLELLVLGRRQFGEFCWINMLTPQPAEAREFFSSLLGWTYAELPGLGRRMQVGGKDIGGLFDLAGPNTPPGLPPCIGVMVKVENADETCAKIAQHGGRAQPPFDVMENLRMAVCFDPCGANFDLFQPKQQHGADADPLAHGAPSWFENLSPDVPRAARFYAEVFGWRAEEMPMPDFKYTTFRRGGTFVAGMMPILPHMGKVPAHWAVYFTVQDVDETAAEAARLGGTICLPPQDIPGVGRFCGLVSPQGVMFYVITYRR